MNGEEPGNLHSPSPISAHLARTRDIHCRAVTGSGPGRARGHPAASLSRRCRRTACLSLVVRVAQRTVGPPRVAGPRPHGQCRHGALRPSATHEQIIRRSQRSDGAPPLSEHLHCSGKAFLTSTLPQQLFHCRRQSKCNWEAAGAAALSRLLGRCRCRFFFAVAVTVAVTVTVIVIPASQCAVFQTIATVFGFFSSCPTSRLRFVVAPAVTCSTIMEASTRHTTVATDGVLLSYTLVGSGTTKVLCIPGMCTPGSMWAPQVAAFLAGGNVSMALVDNRTFLS